MKVTSLKIFDIKLIEPDIFEDERGFFFECFNQSKLNKLLNLNINFVQDNHSSSKKGVLRGLHLQLPPFSQGKLIRTISGESAHVVVDLRKNSPTFGDFIFEHISADNKKQIWAPEGFAHGFLALTETVELLYKTTAIYNKDSEITINYDDPYLNIPWPGNIKKIFSKKDSEGISFDYYKKNNI